MKTMTLRTLVREPKKVKRLTRTGESVTITDNGDPLWVLQPAGGAATDEKERRIAIDEILDEVLCQEPSGISLSKIVLESRR
jgi:hypothetical protein